MEIKIKKCPKCGREGIRMTRGVCFNCYRKFIWKKPKGICKRCKRLIFIHAKGYCGGCYNFIFHLEKTKSYNYKKSHGIDIILYRKITKKCMICGFDKVVELHHLDHDHKNSSEGNLIGLCPNHHKMLHHYKYKKEIIKKLKEKKLKNLRCFLTS
ncbi:MAG: hypothetical protein KKG75_01925 [Nanoarchaeota archaeon]|nr:hypothetical protein [Nanoarchaeota archaeon]